MAVPAMEQRGMAVPAMGFHGRDARVTSTRQDAASTSNTRKDAASTFARAPRRTFGYIMVEMLVAMTILSISLGAIHRSVFQAVTARRLAEELTIARHLLEHVVAKVEMRPDLVLKSERGNFQTDGYPQYGFEYTITRIDAPLRGRAARFLGTDQVTMQYQDYIGKLTVKVFLEREGPGEPKVTGETLLRPGQLWLPQAER